MSPTKYGKEKTLGNSPTKTGEVKFGSISPFSAPKISEKQLSSGGGELTQTTFDINDRSDGTIISEVF